MSRVAVVIPNWNGLRWLAPCLDALRRQTFRDFEVVVVDNGSTDGSLALLEGTYPEARVVALSGNLGFAAGVNAGIRASAGEFVVALNNDTEADPGWLAALVAEIDRQPPDVGFAASRLLDFHDRTTIDSVGDGLSLIGVGYKIGAGERDAGQYAAPFETLSACAAASLYRRAMLDDVGLFDEAFFAYMEDVELGLRAQIAGYRCVAVPAAVVRHVGSATSGGGPSPFTVRMTTRNVYALILKTAPVAIAPLMLMLTAAAQVALVVKCLVTGRPAWLRRNLGAYRAGLAGAARIAPAMLAKRREVRRAGLVRHGAARIWRLLPLTPPRAEGPR